MQNMLPEKHPGDKTYPSCFFFLAHIYALLHLLLTRTWCNFQYEQACCATHIILVQTRMRYPYNVQSVNLMLKLIKQFSFLNSERGNENCFINWLKPRLSIKIITHINQQNGESIDEKINTKLENDLGSQFLLEQWLLDSSPRSP